MIAVVQRVLSGRVTVEGQVVGSIGRGLVVLLAVERGDAEPEAAWMASKLAGLRVFPADEDRPFDLDVTSAGGAILLVSNFTVAASCAKGRRPSLEAAAPPGEAQPVFDRVRDQLAAAGVKVETGRFGAMMQVELTNDGPVTFLVQTPRA
jgi:D-tyrosyl-tRNA(Tyr) deacylase